MIQGMRDRWLSIASAAELIDYTPRTISKLVALGKIPATYLGFGTRKRVRIRLSDLLVHMEPLVPGSPNNIRMSPCAANLALRGKNKSEERGPAACSGSTGE